MKEGGGVEKNVKSQKEGERSTQRCKPESFQQKQGGATKFALVTLAKVRSARKLKTRTQAFWVLVSLEIHGSAPGISATLTGKRAKKKVEEKEGE